MLDNRFASLLLAAVLTLTASASAQDAGSLAGVVRDRGHAVLPGVRVDLTDPNDALPPRSAVTNRDGQYRFEPLPPGDYRLTFSLQGFDTLVREDVVISPGPASIVDAVLKIGSIAERVVIAGVSPRILCGLMILPADPRLDRKFRVPPTSTPKMKIIEPSICR